MRRFLFLLSLFLFWNLAQSAPAAPVLAPGQMIRFAPPFGERLTTSGFTGQVRLFTQTSQTPQSRKRFPWIDPDDPNQEERHRQRNWKTEMRYEGAEVIMGYAFPSAVTLYGVCGIAQTEIDYWYKDETRSYSVTTSFEEDARLFYGAGVTASMGRWKPDDVTTIELDLDLRYRHQMLNPDADDAGREYEGCFHEAQLSFAIGMIRGPWTPFAGIRLTYLDGEETFTDAKKEIHFTETVDPAKDVGYFFGIRYQYAPSWDITASTRAGDETGFTLGCGWRF